LLTIRELAGSRLTTRYNPLRTEAVLTEAARKRCRFVAESCGNYDRDIMLLVDRGGWKDSHGGRRNGERKPATIEVIRLVRDARPRRDASCAAAAAQHVGRDGGDRARETAAQAAGLSARTARRFRTAPRESSTRESRTLTLEWCAASFSLRGAGPSSHGMVSSIPPTPNIKSTSPSRSRSEWVRRRAVQLPLPPAESGKIRGASRRETRLVVQPSS